MEEGQMLKQKSVTPISELRGCRATMERIACHTKGIPDESAEHLGVAMSWLDSAIEKIGAKAEPVAGSSVPPKTFAECGVALGDELTLFGDRIRAMLRHETPPQYRGDHDDMGSEGSELMLAYLHLKEARTCLRQFGLAQVTARCDKGPTHLGALPRRTI